MPDNGIKFLARGGIKLADALEDAIEAHIGEEWVRPTGADVGRVSVHQEGADTYVAHLLSTLPHSLDGLRIVVDAANGAASIVGPAALRSAGAEVIEIHTAPTGLNINDNCGSTHLGSLIEAVRRHGAHAGVAFDGDADRCLAVDASGAEIDGDHVLAILGIAMRERGTLRENTVVATVMANLGFKLALQAAELTVIETGVGDRYVLEAMRDGNFSLGGEQSGHIIMSDHATTGDGVLTALHVLARMAETGRSLEDLASVVTKFPQVLINVAGVDKTRVATDAVLSAAIAEAESQMAGAGRVLLRPSGTEPVVRVMVEAATAEQADQIARSLADVVQTTLALG